MIVLTQLLLDKSFAQKGKNIQILHNYIVLMLTLECCVKRATISSPFLQVPVSIGDMPMTKLIEDSWGYASHEMYIQRWELIRPHIHGQDFVLVDWGSDAGWFSIRIAQDFPRAVVISVEAGVMSHGEGIRIHENKLLIHHIHNNIIVNTGFSQETFAGLQTVPTDYQLVLSVFHHLGNVYGTNLNGEAEWDNAFCNLIMGSNITFFEVPNENGPHETPLRIREWYDGRDIETVLNAALRRGNVKANIQLLGETLHGGKGMRQLFKISRAEAIETVSSEAVASYIEGVGRNISVHPLRRLRLLVSKIGRTLRPGGNE